MARRTIVTCDRCGDEGGDGWAEQISRIRTFTPEDGINGGVQEKDLCFDCRCKLNSLIVQFLYYPYPPIRKTEDERQI